MSNKPFFAVPIMVHHPQQSTRPQGRKKLVVYSVESCQEVAGVFKSAEVAQVVIDELANGATVQEVCTWYQEFLYKENSADGRKQA